MKYFKPFLLAVGMLVVAFPAFSVTDPAKAKVYDDVIVKVEDVLYVFYNLWRRCSRQTYEGDLGEVGP